MRTYTECLAYALEHNLLDDFLQYLHCQCSDRETLEDGLEALTYAIANDCFYNNEVVHLFARCIDSLNVAIVRRIHMLSDLYLQNGAYNHA